MGSHRTLLQALREQRKDMGGRARPLSLRSGPGYLRGEGLATDSSRGRTCVARLPRLDKAMLLGPIASRRVDTAWG